MVKKYVILAYSNDETFDIPRQLLEINGEKLVARTIRLLKENGVQDIILTAKDKRFDELGVTRYECKTNDFDYIKRTGYWLNAFPFELMNEPVCFIWGDVYFSEQAIKTIVETETDENLFFCSYNNESKKYIKHHDEPFAYKIVDTDLFKKHIEIVKKLYDEGKTCRHPIVWEVYRSMNGLDVNEHIMTKNYIAINDITCDIDTKDDIIKLREEIKKMIKCEVIKRFSLERFGELKNIERASAKKDEGELYVGDRFECDKEIVDYLNGNNVYGKSFIKILEVISDVEDPIGKKILEKANKKDDKQEEKKPIEVKKKGKKKKDK